MLDSFEGNLEQTADGSDGRESLRSSPLKVGTISRFMNFRLALVLAGLLSVAAVVSSCKRDQAEKVENHCDNDARKEFNSNVGALRLSLFGIEFSSASKAPFLIRIYGPDNSLLKENLVSPDDSGDVFFAFPKGYDREELRIEIDDGKCKAILPSDADRLFEDLKGLHYNEDSKQLIFGRNRGELLVEYVDPVTQKICMKKRIQLSPDSETSLYVGDHGNRQVLISPSIDAHPSAYYNATKLIEGLGPNPFAAQSTGPHADRPQRREIVMPRLPFDEPETAKKTPSNPFFENGIVLFTINMGNKKDFFLMEGYAKDEVSFDINVFMSDGSVHKVGPEKMDPDQVRHKVVLPDGAKKLELYFESESLGRRKMGSFQLRTWEH